MTKEELNTFLGTGWSFPPTFSKSSGGVLMVDNEENIAKSIKIIVFTRLRERIFHPDLGTNINDFIFSRNISSIEMTRLKRTIEYAITENEYRVDVDSVDVINNLNEDCIEISVSYTIKAYNTSYSMVFPFYYESGTKI